MILQEDNSDPVQIRPLPKPTGSSWGQRPLCHWDYANLQLSAGMQQHGVEFKNIPGAVLEIVRDRLTVLMQEPSGLGELARQINPRLVGVAKVLNADGTVAYATLYFRVDDVQLSALSGLLDTIYLEDISPYLVVNDWPLWIVYHRECERIGRFLDRMPTTQELRQILDHFTELVSTPIGRGLITAWARENDKIAGDSLVHVRVKGSLEVTIGDDAQGLVKNFVNIDQYAHQSIYAPIMIYNHKSF